MKDFKLRKAQPDELQTLIAIDDESTQLYEEAGLKIELESDHPFVVAESVRWAKAINQGLAYVVANSLNTPIGFIALSIVDNAPYLDQISVHPGYMRQGVGAGLLQQAISWSGDQPLWLTTYSHLAWNRPFYEKYGFVTIPEKLCGPELCDILKKQRLALPAPDKRIAMVRGN